MSNGGGAGSPAPLGLQPSLRSCFPTFKFTMIETSLVSWANVQRYLDLVYPFFVFFLGPQVQHMEVSRLGVESELQPLAYTTARARPDP